jgi:F0F1-type ATP synthase membrane subunit b/b'
MGSMSTPVDGRTLTFEEATLEARRIVTDATDEAELIVAQAQQRATAVYEAERNRAVKRLAEVRDEYELLSSRLRALKEAIDRTMTGALRDHRAIRRVFDQ